MTLFASDKFSQQRFRKRLITYEVIVDEKDMPYAEGEQSVELRQNLCRLLDTRLAPANHDDVAELAEKWAPPRKLDRRGCVMFSAYHIEAGSRQARHVRRHVLLVSVLKRAACCNIIKKTRPRLIGLSDEQNITAPLEML